MYGLPYDIERIVRQYIYGIEFAFPETRHNVLAAVSLCYILKLIRSARGSRQLFPEVHLGLIIAGVDTLNSDCVRLYHKLPKAKVHLIKLPGKDGRPYNSYALVFKKKPKRK